MGNYSKDKKKESKKGYKGGAYHKHQGKRRKYLSIYCDASYRGYNDKHVGGWGAVFEYSTGSQCYWGVCRCETSNHAELKACISAMLQIEDKSQKIVIYSDSKYVIDGVNKYISGWKRNDWHTRKGTDIENKEDWKFIDSFKSQFKDISFRYVKGHHKCEGNILADQLARKCLLSYMQERSKCAL